MDYDDGDGYDAYGEIADPVDDEDNYVEEEGEDNYDPFGAESDDDQEMGVQAIAEHEFDQSLGPVRSAIAPVGATVKIERGFVPDKLNNNGDAAASKRKHEAIPKEAMEIARLVVDTRKKRSRKKAPKLPERVEKLIAQLTRLKNRRLKDEKVAHAKQRIRQLEGLEDDYSTEQFAADEIVRLARDRARAEKRSLPRLTPGMELAEPIGFDSDTLEKRLQQGCKHDWEVARQIRSTTTRFSPFLVNTDYSMERCGELYDHPTTLSCYWCTEPCNSVPVPMPRAISHRGGEGGSERHPHALWDRRRTEEVFKVEGIYCSFNCMVTHAREKDVPRHLLTRLLKVVYDIPVGTVIDQAMPRYCLRKFGGQYTVEEFRASARMGIKSSMVQLPFIPLQAGSEEIESVTTTISERIGTLDQVIARMDSMFGSWGTHGTISLSKQNDGRNFVSLRTNNAPTPLGTTVSKKRKSDSLGVHDVKQEEGTRADTTKTSRLTVEQQLDRSESRFRLQMEHFDTEGKPVVKKRLTMKDYMTRRG
jgi:hypothetical protein